jgi:hypothetical protein
MITSFHIPSNSLFTNHPANRRYVVWANDAAVKHATDQYKEACYRGAEHEHTHRVHVSMCVRSRDWRIASEYSERRRTVGSGLARRFSDCTISVLKHIVQGGTDSNAI